MFSRIRARIRSCLAPFVKRMSHLTGCVFVYSLRKIKEPSIRPKTLLLMRLDAIGDYTLFRNFLKPLREAYAGYKITFLCNVDFLEILNAYDRSCVDDVIPLDTREWYSIKGYLFYRYKVLYLLNQQGYEIIINPTYHRFPMRDDYLVGFINAQYKIGSRGFEMNEQWRNAPTRLNSHDRVYTTLLHATFEVLFEFERNREFFSQLLQRPLTEVQYNLPLPPLPTNSSLSLPTKDYCIFFLGAKSMDRKWALTSWVALAQKISPSFQIVLCGSKGEIQDAAQIMMSIPQALNLVGKTTYIELLHVLSKVRFIVSNETAIPHFCMALGLGPIFIISNGNTFGRFVPYPKHMDTNYHVIYHPKVEALLQTPHGFGRCIEIYKYGGIDLQTQDPQLLQMVVDKIAAVNPEFIKKDELSK